MIINPKDRLHLASFGKGIIVTLLAGLILFTWISKVMQDRLDTCNQTIEELNHDADFDVDRLDYSNIGYYPFGFYGFVFPTTQEGV